MRAMLASADDVRPTVAGLLVTTMGGGVPSKKSGESHQSSSRREPGGGENHVAPASGAGVGGAIGTGVHVIESPRTPEAAARSIHPGSVTMDGGRTSGACTSSILGLGVGAVAPAGRIGSVRSGAPALAVELRCSSARGGHIASVDGSAGVRSRSVSVKACRSSRAPMGGGTNAPRKDAGGTNGIGGAPALVSDGLEVGGSAAHEGVGVGLGSGLGPIENAAGAVGSPGRGGSTAVVDSGGFGIGFGAIGTLDSGDGTERGSCSGAVYTITGTVLGSGKGPSEDGDSGVGIGRGGCESMAAGIRTIFRSGAGPIDDRASGGVERSTRSGALESGAIAVRSGAPGAVAVLPGETLDRGGSGWCWCAASATGCSGAGPSEKAAGGVGGLRPGASGSTRPSGTRCSWMAAVEPVEGVGAPGRGGSFMAATSGDARSGCGLSAKVGDGGGDDRGGGSAAARPSGIVCSWIVCSWIAWLDLT